MVDVGTALGAVALVVALVSLGYARSQATAARRQADAQARVTLLESNLAMYERLRATRRRFVEVEPIKGEWLATFPHLAKAYDDAGGIDAYYTLREGMDTLQEIYFLRRDGVIEDHTWYVWENTIFRHYTKLPSFREVFRFASEQGYLHPQFTAFYARLLEESVVEDPLRPEARAARPR